MSIENLYVKSLCRFFFFFLFFDAKGKLKSNPSLWRTRLGVALHHKDQGNPTLHIQGMNTGAIKILTLKY
jgi:hypothetical protein